MSLDRCGCSDTIHHNPSLLGCQRVGLQDGQPDSGATERSFRGRLVPCFVPHGIQHCFAHGRQSEPYSTRSLQASRRATQLIGLVIGARQSTPHNITPSLRGAGRHAVHGSRLYARRPEPARSSSRWLLFLVRPRPRKCTQGHA